MKSGEAEKARKEQTFAERYAALRAEGVEPKALLDEAGSQGLDVGRIKEMGRQLARERVPASDDTNDEHADTPVRSPAPRSPARRPARRKAKA